MNYSLLADLDGAKEVAISIEGESGWHTGLLLGIDGIYETNQMIELDYPSPHDGITIPKDLIDDVQRDDEGSVYIHTVDGTIFAFSIIGDGQDFSFSE